MSPSSRPRGAIHVKYSASLSGTCPARLAQFPQYLSLKSFRNSVFESEDLEDHPLVCWGESREELLDLTFVGFGWCTKRLSGFRRNEDEAFAGDAVLTAAVLDRKCGALNGGWFRGLAAFPVHGFNAQYAVCSTKGPNQASL
jgi:hypothetical protein